MSAHFRHFTTHIDGIEIPDHFTYPFDYVAHPLASIAVTELTSFLENIPISVHDFNAIGKMFGVMVVKTTEGQIGYLAAFSGKLQIGNHLDFFVPPLFDMLIEDGFYRKGEHRLDQLNLQIETLEKSNDWKEIVMRYDQSLKQLTQELEMTQETFRKGKAERKATRKQLEAHQATQELNQIKVIHEKESHYQQFLIKEKKEEILRVQKEKESSEHPFKIQLNTLKTARKELSNQLQQQLFNQYNFLNILGESKNVLDIFKGDLPPAGTGECAAPKLLQYAFQNGYTPICMAEFWWGIAPNKEIRKHGEFYPACRSKCFPVLSHMLKGLKVNPDPRTTKGERSFELNIIFEDEDIIVVDKPAEMLSVPGKTNQESVESTLKSKFPELEIALVHRLDQSTSGVLLVAKHHAAYVNLQQQFTNRTVKKRYVAILNGNIDTPSGKINLPLRVDLDNRPRQLVCFDHGKEAITHFQVLEIKDNLTRIAFFPQTGRTHQLRVHSAHQQGLQVPILGDDLYGQSKDRLYLHAAQLTILHPKTGEEITFKSKVPF